VVVNDRTIPNDFQPSTPKIQKKYWRCKGNVMGIYMMSCNIYNKCCFIILRNEIKTYILLTFRTRCDVLDTSIQMYVTSVCQLQAVGGCFHHVPSVCQLHAVGGYFHHVPAVCQLHAVGGCFHHVTSVCQLHAVGGCFHHVTSFCQLRAVGGCFHLVLRFHPRLKIYHHRLAKILSNKR
jgi:hypothetical protein